jgi:two-component system cell cycle response regulator
MTLRLIQNSRITLLDTDSLRATALTAELASLGFSVTPVTSVAEALGSLDINPADIVIASQSGFEGTHLVDALQEQCGARNIPLIALLDGSNEALRIEILEHGASDYVTTPIGTAELGARISLCLRSATRVADLQKESRIDALTGLKNRRAILDYLRTAYHQTIRSRRTLCLLLIDVDSFKPINDTYGHSEGDRVLQALSVAFERVLRGGDTVGRLGGDEFLVVLPDATAPHAGVVVERLRAAAEQILVGNTSTHVEISVGIAPLVENMSVEELIESADQDMYQDKQLKHLRAA